MPTIILAVLFTFSMPFSIILGYHRTSIRDEAIDKYLNSFEWRHGKFGCYRIVVSICCNRLSTRSDSWRRRRWSSTVITAVCQPVIYFIIDISIAISSGVLLIINETKWTHLRPSSHSYYTRERKSTLIFDIYRDLTSI